jgi:hypothetical protein
MQGFVSLRSLKKYKYNSVQKISWQIFKGTRVKNLFALQVFKKDKKEALCP